MRKNLRSGITIRTPRCASGLRLIYNQDPMVASINKLPGMTATQRAVFVNNPTDYLRTSPLNHPVVIDVETQHVFRDVGGDVKKLRISVAGLYDYATDSFHAFAENELNKLFPFLENASAIIGFNIIHFDLPVLSPYYVGDLLKLPTLDMFVDVEKFLGHRVSLDSLLQETLNNKKEGHGLQAVEFFKEGKLEELKNYCLSDVRLTRDLYEYGKEHKKVFAGTYSGRKEIPVAWDAYKKDDVSTSINLTLGL